MEGRDSVQQTVNSRWCLAYDTIDRQDINKLVEWLQTYPRLTKGPITADFESRWSQWLGASHSIFCNSGSSANLLMYYALLASGRLKNKKVIVPSVGWVTSIAPAIQFGFDPIMCEADPDTFGLDLNHLEALLKQHQPQTVMLVQVLGVPHKMREMMALKERYGFVLLEDACAAIGASYDGRKVGSFGDMASFSFYFGHQMSTIEGGMVSTNDKALADLLLMLRSHGWSKDLDPAAHRALVTQHQIDDFHSPFVFYEPGFNLRSTDLNAFIGIGQVEKLDWMTEQRRTNHGRYLDRLSSSFYVQRAPPNSRVASISVGFGQSRASPVLDKPIWRDQFPRRRSDSPLRIFSSKPCRTDAGRRRRDFADCSGGGMTGPLVVTGGTGLLGSAIRKIHPDAVFLSRADGDLRDRSVAQQLLEKIRPSHVIHLAGLVGGVKANAANNSRFFEENVQINAAVLSAARSLEIQSLVSVLSSCAFPLFVGRATTEDDLQSAFPYDGNAGYGYAKRMLDLHTRLVAKDTGWKWTTLTPVTLYGPQDSCDSESGHVVGALISRCWAAKLSGDPFVVWGSGRAVRQFVFVDDVAKIAVEAVQRGRDSTTTIIAPDEGITIQTLAETIASVLGYSGPIVFDRSQPEGVLVKRLHSMTFSERFPDCRFTSLRAGLEATVRWFRVAISMTRTQTHVLVTGGAGYIGSVLCKQLLDRGYRVTVLDSFLYRQNSLLDCCACEAFRVVRGDCRDERIVTDLLRDADVIIPLAALVGAPLCNRDRVGAYTINFEAVQMLSKLTSQQQQIIFPVTNSGYGIGQPGIPCTEDSPLRPISLYGETKVKAERVVLDRGNAITLRLATVFGASPRMRMDLLVNDFVWRAVHDRAVVVFEGHCKRNYIHIRDVVKAFLHAMDHFESMKNRAYNVGLDDANLSKLELCREIQRHIPQFVFFEAPIGEDPDKRDYIVSNERILSTGFTPDWSLERGIQELTKCYTIVTGTGYGNV
ncbi:hypothetical protein B566_EDAN000527 [Ephemera danica]|nr:hypothetical protein B566_EDAN000527 [Ephemera danica]